MNFSRTTFLIDFEFLFSSFDFTLFLKKTSSQKKNENDDRKRAPGDTCELAAKGQQQQQQRRRCRLHFLICSR